jgi:hypothetical protein
MFRASRRLRRRTLVGLAVLGVAAIAGGVAWATIPGGDGVIRGCYQKSSGILRVLDGPRDRCTRSERPIEWNVAGPQGLPGEQGPPGEQGVPGPGAGAVYAEFTSGAGGSGAIDVPEGGPDDAIEVVRVALPDGWTGSQVGIATVRFANHGDAQGNVTCAILSDAGGYGAGGIFVPAPGEGVPYVQFTFQADGPPGGGGTASEVWISCFAPTEGNPPGTPDIWVEEAMLTVIPLAA